jgi:ubiquinone/menaquinone biosynthesis C-methylase UbiE
MTKLSQSNPTMSTFSFPDPEDYARFRQVLLDVGFTAEGVLKTLGVQGPPAIHGNDLPVLMRRTRQGTPCDILIRLFLIEVPVEIEAVRQAILPMQIETLEQAGLIEINGPSVTAAVKLLPYNDLYVAFDRPRRLQDGMADYVMGIGRSSIMLANLTVRRHSQATLDLGTGCGIQALHAARHSDHVLAADLNPRAVRMASFNAKLNGMQNVECVEGDLFAPARGKKFDLVISNPPFVISPEARYIYRDGGMEGDDICRKIVREAPRFLREGGFCQILCNWVEKEGQDWQERLADWFHGTGCDAWVMRSETQDIETYATTWIRHTELHDTSEFAHRFEQWVSYYEGKGIDAISAGVITMRRTDHRTTWFRADDAPRTMIGPAGESIAKGFELRDFLETVRDDAALLEASFSLSPDASLERTYKPSPEGWMDDTLMLSLNRGFSYSGAVDQYVADILIACNGKRRLADVLDRLAAMPGIDQAKLKQTFCSVARRLIEHGFLLP